MNNLALTCIFIYLLIESEETAFAAKLSKKERKYLNFAGNTIAAVSLKCDILNKLRKFKQPIQPEKVSMYFYMNTQFVRFPMSDAAQKILEDPNFNIRSNTIIYVHGFNGVPVSNRLMIIGKRLASKGNYNFLSMDITAYTHTIDYIKVVSFVPHLGHLLFDFISFMYNNGMSHRSLHLVGHSLGSQISGYAARKFKETYNTTLPRITALDPATPCFITSQMMLTKEDADYVDVIHTSILSYKEDLIGHADYIVNSRGGFQPGCLDIDIPCAHSRAITLFTESVVNERGFVAKKCVDDEIRYDCRYSEVSLMGFASRPGSRGFYFLKTNASSPFALGYSGIV